MKDTGHVETAPHEELVRRHRQALVGLEDAVENGLDEDLISRLESAEIRYRLERLRRAAERRP